MEKNVKKHFRFAAARKKLTYNDCPIPHNENLSKIGLLKFVVFEFEDLHPFDANTNQRFKGAAVFLVFQKSRFSHSTRMPNWKLLVDGMNGVKLVEGSPDVGKCRMRVFVNSLKICICV